MTRAIPAGRQLNPGDTRKGTRLIYLSGRDGSSPRYVLRKTAVVNGKQYSYFEKQFAKPATMSESTFRALGESTIRKLPHQNITPKSIGYNHPYGAGFATSHHSEAYRKAVLSRIQHKFH